MAGKATGSGQGGVRIYRTGRMVKCSDEGCMRAVRYIAADGDGRSFTWKCGGAPLLPKALRVGQQKQYGKKKR